MTARASEPAPPAKALQPKPETCVTQVTFWEASTLRAEKNFDAGGRVVRWMSRTRELQVEFDLRYSYDAQGREVLREDHTHHDLWTWEYASDGRPLTYYASREPRWGEMFKSFLYDDQGRLLSIQKQREGLLYTTEHFQYDAAGRKTRIEERSPSGERHGIVVFFYHDNGVLKRKQGFDYRALLQIDEEFDLAGRLLFKSEYRLGGALHSVHYTYDASGRVTEQHDRHTGHPFRASNTVVTRTFYDAQGRIEREEVENVDDYYGRETRSLRYKRSFIHAPELVRVEQYNASGVVEGMKELDYDSLGRLTLETFSGEMAKEQSAIEHHYMSCAP